MKKSLLIAAAMLAVSFNVNAHSSSLQPIKADNVKKIECVLFQFLEGFDTQTVNFTYQEGGQPSSISTFVTTAEGFRANSLDDEFFVSIDQNNEVEISMNQNVLARYPYNSFIIREKLNANISNGFGIEISANKKFTENITLTKYSVTCGQK